MRLLLLLSALLAALSGGAQARGPRAEAVAVAAGLSAPAPAPAHAQILATARPSAAPTPEATSAKIGVARLPAPRLWMLRRRE